MTSSTQVAFDRLQSSRAGRRVVADAMPTPHWADTEPMLRRSEAFAEDLTDLAQALPKDLPLSNLAHRGWVQRAMQAVKPANWVAAAPSAGQRDLLVLAASLAVLRVTEIEFQLRQL